MPDIVENEHNGLLIGRTDAVALEDAISRMVSSVELRQRLGETARQTMERYIRERWARPARGTIFGV